ncbi:MAG: enterotoxin (HBL) [Porticoccaceae bacterium]|jgi:phage host-nuclease inhibitor protein Gam|nr:enterotoxin (HBL) [Porticoccaceae bacterium]
MALANAIKKNAVSLAVKQNSYKQNVVAVNTLITSVLSSSLPTLNQNPPDWKEFQSAYEKADAGALTWVNNVMARLLNVPDDVKSYNSTITQLLANAKTQAQTLEADPGNKTALDTLNTDLTNVNSTFSLVVTFITGALNAIKSFKDELPTMATNLQTIADDSTKAASADQAQIDKLNQDIDNLHAEIKSLTASIIALGIADGIALTLGTVATIAAFPEGALVWFVLGPVVAVATTYIAIDGLKIKADNAAIKADEAQITGLTADVSTLHILSKNFAAMSAQTVEIESNLQAILNEWQTLETDVNTAVTDIKSAVADTSSANFAAVVSELDDAVSEWNAAYKQAGDLHLDLNVNDAQLSVGMSSAEVQAATAKGKAVDIISYYNNVQTQRSKTAA